MSQKKFRTPWQEAQAPAPEIVQETPQPARADTDGWVDIQLLEREVVELLRRINRDAPNVTRLPGEARIALQARTVRAVLSPDEKGKIDASMVKSWQTLA